MPPDLLTRYCARLLVDSVNARYDTAFTLGEASEGEPLIATDGTRRLGLHIAPLWERENSTAWEQRLDVMASRLPQDGAYLLWVPPRADVSAEEPAASDFVRRVAAATASSAPGARTEVSFPVNVRMGKQREEGGYASVIGGMSRWWTRITEKVQGTFSVDSSNVHRLTHDGDAREQLWETIGRLSYSVETGQAVEFEVDEAWTLQRLADDAGRGFVVAGAPPEADPTEGIAVRRTARRRLQAANETLAALDVGVRAVGLIGCYEYAEVETASATIKALDPGLFSRLEIVSLIIDGDVKPVFLPKTLA
jgi:hypothetical protein